MSEKLANPAPLGLLGFGMTTVLLNLHNAGFYGLNSMILAMGLAYGGLAQVIAGVMEYKKGNTFGTVAFSSYGLFWWSLVILLVFPQASSLVWNTVPPSPLQSTPYEAMAAYFFMWGLFTFVMFFGTLKTNRALQFVFMSLAILFFLLTIRDYAFASGLTDVGSNVGKLAGFEGIICGLSAVYLALAEVLNEVHGRTVVPICPVQK
ncbi:MAG: acetate uptake transporter [Candidatus Bathyarchaeia archaeon]|jgi:succinate-acetate transporter protein|nr:acetate uptake transporter [Candidatus Bathyarchaeota archaeon A05DMB-4]MDH7596013.1 acetate uptake transporter [Candidatus Bathyarchaeota archaeon]